MLLLANITTAREVQNNAEQGRKGGEKRASSGGGGGFKSLSLFVASSKKHKTNLIRDNLFAINSDGFVQFITK